MTKARSGPLCPHCQTTMALDPHSRHPAGSWRCTTCSRSALPSDGPADIEVREGDRQWAFSLLAAEDRAVVAVREHSRRRFGRSLHAVGAVPDHRCDESCRCPLHGTALYYWPAGDLHACQDSNCGYAQGIPAEELASASTAEALQRSAPRRAAQAAARSSQRIAQAALSTGAPA
ncbi:hypothetical protein [Streptomyces sp. AC1-42T]|uniref:hypothetical protein n=1 Tax=Streptomyces sp. AC1-42T TaxID=2218665 RepID=UPI000DB1571D|nr:hypothetical protein [Streptomyces sp. AC1-42T]PZT71471.1 hypothetical protein DNK55_32685 [Streptomyces sp. AC1-42T]